MPPALRLGLLGAARITPKAVVRPARRRIDADVEVVAIAARDPARARRLAEENAVPRVLPDYAALIASSEIDAIYVALPAALHCSWSIAALQSGKHVLCEKPFASNADEARRMVAAAGAAGRVLMEAFHYRYHPLVTEILALRDRGELGTLKSVTGEFVVGIDPGDIRFQLPLGGGALMDLGCYAVHWLRTVTGAEPRVRSASAVEAGPAVDLEMSAELEFPDGTAGHVRCSMAEGVAFRASLVIEGTLAALEVDNPLAPHRGHRLRLRRPNQQPRDWTVTGMETYDYQLAAFLRAARGEETSLTGGADSINNMATIDAIYEASGLGRRGG